MSGGNAGGQAASAGSNAVMGGAVGLGGVSEAGAAGETTAGEGGLNASGGEGAGTAGDGGAAGNAGSGGEGGFFVAKFCNTLTFAGEPITMILDVGEGAERVTFSAVTNTCSPADGDACRPIPAGADIRIQLSDATDVTIPLDTAIASIEAGAEMVFYTDVTSGQPVWDGVLLDGNPTCQEFSFDDL